MRFSPCGRVAGTIGVCRACDATVVWLVVTERGEVEACDPEPGVIHRGTPHRLSCNPSGEIAAVPR